MKCKSAQLFFFIAIGQLFYAFSTHAAPTDMNHNEIRRQVSQFLTEKTRELNFKETQIKVSHIDNRLRLARCDNDLEIIMGNNRLLGNVSLAVQCKTNKSWKIYLQASINAYQKIYVAKSAIPRGSPFTDADLILEKRNITTLNGNYLTNSIHIKTHIAKRPIRKGEIIKPHLMTKSKLIKRGDQVTLIAESSGITVRMMGKALNDAMAGQQVRVKNNNSKRIVEGTAVNRGVVQINM